MNTILKTFSFAVIGSMMSIVTAQAAGFSGASSDSSKIVIKNTSPTSNPHSTGGNQPGIQVTGAQGPFAQALLSFKTYQQFAGNDGEIDSYKISTLRTTDMPASHSSLGNFDFAQVPGQDVYFGEWKSNTSSSDDTHTVYYGGKNKADNLPNSGTAIYNVRGMNNFYANGSLMQGSLTADFNTNTIGGQIHDGVFHVLIDNNTINANDASFSGVAKAYVEDSVLDGNGHSQGHFFGANGESLAGIVSFPNTRDLDTAFGGKKVSP